MVDSFQPSFLEAQAKRQQEDYAQRRAELEQQRAVRSRERQHLQHVKRCQVRN